MRFTFRLLAAAAAVALSVGAANAAPIQLFNTVYGGSTTPDTSNLILMNGALTSVNPSQPASDGFGNIPFGTYSVTNMPIGLAPFTTNPGPVSLPATLTVTGLGGSFPGDLGDTAIFSLVAGTTQLTESGGVDSLTAIYQLTSVSGIAGLDFGPLGTRFLMTGSFQNTTFTAGPGGGTFAGTAPSSSSFTFVVLPVPEPMSLTVFGVLALGGVAAVARRKLLARKSVASAA